MDFVAMLKDLRRYTLLENVYYHSALKLCVR